MLGKKIKDLVSEEKPAGLYEINFDGGDLPSGIYLYRLESNNYSYTKKNDSIKINAT